METKDTKRSNLECTDLNESVIEGTIYCDSTYPQPAKISRVIKVEEEETDWESSLVNVIDDYRDTHYVPQGEKSAAKMEMEMVNGQEVAVKSIYFTEGMKDGPIPVQHCTECLIYKTHSKREQTRNQSQQEIHVQTSSYPDENIEGKYLPQTFKDKTVSGGSCCDIVEQTLGCPKKEVNTRNAFAPFTENLENGISSEAINLKNGNEEKYASGHYQASKNVGPCSVLRAKIEKSFSDSPDGRLSKCQSCGREFFTKNHLTIHEKTRAVTNPLSSKDICWKKPFECQLCMKHFTTRFNLERHRKIHYEEKKFICYFCGKTFVQKVHLKTHERMHTGDKPFTCKHCHQKFSRKATLTQHERIHTGEKPFRCEHCNKKFSHRTYLKQHEKIHSGERPFRCGYCSKEFGRKAFLQQHVRIHTGEKPFECEYCYKKFSRRTNLMQHKIMHDAEKQFKCGYCGRKFCRKTSLEQHRRIHSGESRF